MNKLHYSLEEIPPVLLAFLALLLLFQGTWMFRDARKRDRFPWLWGLWGITSIPGPLLIYWLIVIRTDRKRQAGSKKNR
ncbi:hypothetical protein [Paenibacillus silvae]|uniref:SigmaY antisigma factor component n=1 Tax=Paenibacillus silvae TaxID=1325358 RepID=A0A2W6NP61_9BACL|nr:hypothetical protein [Paenibacillus silvae]PZT57659.1 hypothetical protein DN757_01085 [Paenibacillus silvae]